LELLGEFDALGAIRYWNDFKSLAHWLSWCCSMTPGVAREHVRVAKALRRMPTIAGLFREGKLSYSKVREVTRVVDVVDEHRLAGLALTATASQLARMIAGFRSADGMRIAQQAKRNLSWHEREDGVIDIRARLPRRRLRCCWRRSLRRRISSDRHQPNQTRAVRNPADHRMLLDTTMRMPWWM
jgi:Domain of unknown function (DUF222)